MESEEYPMEIRYRRGQSASHLERCLAGFLVRNGAGLTTSDTIAVDLTQGTDIEIEIIRHDSWPGPEGDPG